jgi:hypothetical protein
MSIDLIQNNEGSKMQSSFFILECNYRMFTSSNLKGKKNNLNCTGQFSRVVGTTYSLFDNDWSGEEVAKVNSGLVQSMTCYTFRLHISVLKYGRLIVGLG